MPSSHHIGQSLPDFLSYVESLGRTVAEYEDELIVHVAEREEFSTRSLGSLIKDLAI